MLSKIIDRQIGLNVQPNLADCLPSHLTKGTKNLHRTKNVRKSDLTNKLRQPVATTITKFIRTLPSENKEDNSDCSSLKRTLGSKFGPLLSGETSLSQSNGVSETKNVIFLQTDDEPKRLIEDITTDKAHSNKAHTKDKNNARNSSERCRISKETPLMKMDLGKASEAFGINPLLPSSDSIPITRQVVWQMPKMAGIIIANSKFSPVFLRWGTTKLTQDTNIEGRIRSRSEESFESDPESSTQSRSILTPTLSQVDGSSFTTTTASHKPFFTSREASESNLNAMSGVGSSTPSSMACGSSRSTRISEQFGTEICVPKLLSFEPDYSTLFPPPCVSKQKRERVRQIKNETPFTNSLGEKIVITKHRIGKRIRQINIGKKTREYIDYVNSVPKSKRVIGKHLCTPNPKERISKRRFHGKLKSWRRFLHKWNDVARS